ncbi:hypothetical protein NAT51_12855 [Flavobacterium amniphilum]|uniref:hypothetical protein n=1 Tax=Flavobacterium amniphilum TaxID=1834035 RepID=UPI00202A27CE|nr:hypothetical protein [Flavobacterium amniphilum]MCL9805832.1 hypothetical protein [Flavobacterium amniphilum]MCL9806419.1 hypothetical protein [Flavobacterium amniphilum]
MDLKKLLNTTNQNLSLIIIVPPILGGLWQIAELSSISFSFIRFFSVSQMIPDGLLMIFILSIIFGSLYLFYVTVLKTDTNSENTNNNLIDSNGESKLLLLLKIKERNNLIATFFLILFFCFNYLLYKITNYLSDDIRTSLNIFWYVPLNIIISIFILFSWHLGHHSLKIKDYEKKSFLKLILVFIFIEFYWIFSFGRTFHNAFMLPDELENIENLECKIQKIEYNPNYNITYVNDKYVFVKFNKTAFKKNQKINYSIIRIFKFDDLLDDSNCNDLVKKNKSKKVLSPVVDERTLRIIEKAEKNNQNPYEKGF